MQTIKHFTLLTLMVGLCGSCARTPLAEQVNMEQDQISFSTKVVSEQLGNQEEPWNVWSSTKGTPLDPTTDRISSMGMFCYVTTDLWKTAAPTAKPTKMNNVALDLRQEGTEFSWEYREAKVTWQDVPYPANVTFFGYAPVATADNGITFVTDFSTGGASTGAPVLHYTVPTDASKQPDLMVAIPRKDMMRTGNNVALSYRKALTTIGFSIKGSKKQKVTKIYVKGVSLQGDLSLDINDLTPVVWSNLQAVSDTPVVVGKGDAAIEAPGNTTGSAVQLADGYLMMIPQTLGADALVVVELEGEPARAYSLLKLKEKWTPGRSLTYTLFLDETTLVVTPADWLDALATAGFVDVTVSGSPWTSQVEGSGLSITPASGAGASTTVRVSWTANYGVIEPGKRFGTVTFTANSAGYGKYEFYTSQLGEGQAWIEYNGVKWAKGNLIATGDHTCKIGAPDDGGVYFQFGSLIGFKGGLTGNGVGRVNPLWTQKFWDGAAGFVVDNELTVWPTELTAAGGSGKPIKWPYFSNAAKDQVIRESFFDCGGSPYANEDLNIRVSFRDHPGVKSGASYKMGVGDPCTYYLGGDWQMPSLKNWHSLFNYAPNNPWEGAGIEATGAEIDPLGKANIYVADRQITLPISGARSEGRGLLTGIDQKSAGWAPYTQYWSDEVGGSVIGRAIFYQYYPEATVAGGNHLDIYLGNRPAGFPIRCVYNK